MVTGFIAGLFVRAVDVVIGTSPQFFTACAARMVAGFKRVPFVFELRDLWPESIRAVGAMRNSAALRALERIELHLYRAAKCIVSVTHSFKDSLISRGVYEGKIVVVTNGVDMERFSARTKDVELELDLDLRGCFVAGYIGTHGLAHGLGTLLEAAALVQASEDTKMVRLLFLGDGAEKSNLKARAVALKLPNVLFVDSVSKDQVVRYWSILDVSIIHLRKADLFSGVIPSKMFECMGMGIPVLHGVPGESARIVSATGIGQLFESEDARGLADALITLSSNPDILAQYRGNCLKAAPLFDRDALAVQMLEAIIATVTPEK
jgi:glycosyltransferase involved in cell wall biosynthesis